MTKRISLFILLFCAIFFLSACSGENTPPAASPPPAGAPVAGGEIIVGISQDLDASFDAHQITATGTAGTREVFFNVFEGLVKPNPAGELVPAIAESFSIDDTIFTFTLRENVLFHDGSIVTVDDVIYSITRAADPDHTATFVQALAPITRIDAIDAHTIEIELAAPDHEFLAFLTLPIIPAHHTDHAQNPIGTGPFRFVSHTPGQSLTLDRFDDYWDTPAYLDRVVLQIFASGDALGLALNACAVDIAAHLTADMVRALPDGYYYLQGAMSLVQALFLNNAVAPLDDVLVRQALNYAINLQEIMDILANGMGHPLGSMMFPGFTRYFNEELVDFYPHNPDRARELLAQAGFPDGFELVITVPSTYTPHVITAEVIAEQLRAVGVSATLDLVEWAFWVSEVNVGRNFEATIIGIAARDLTARSMLERMVSDNGRNFTNFNYPRYDEVFAAAQRADNPDEQVRLYRELQAILAEQAASVFLQDLVSIVAISGDLAGFTFYPIYVLDLRPIHFIG